jgi:acetylornithine deacetylase/succinyl-diaminopimelate desuccinylase-like protein
VVGAGLGFGTSNRTHSPNENVRIKDFHNAARHIARILDGFADI